MPITLYDAFVPSARQLLTAMRSITDKAEQFAKDQGLEDSALLEAKLAEDMWSLPWHVRSCWVHSAYAIRLLKTGEFTPDFTDVPDSWDSIRAMIDDALAGLDAVTADEMETLMDRPVDFVLGGKVLLTMKGQDFLLSMNQPNLQFHSTTFYGILRSKGMPLSKMDYIGTPPVLG